MSSFRLISAAGVLVAAMPVCLAQTAHKVIDDYLAATGGAKALARLRSETLAGNLTDQSSGVTGSWSLISRAPNSFYQQIIADAESSSYAYNGMSAWTQNSGEGAVTLTGTAARQAEAEGVFLNGRLADLKRDRLTVQLAGAAKLRGRDAYHVQVLSAAGLSREIFIDVKTHLMVREVSPDGETFEYDDYRPVQGIQTPFAIELHRGGHDYKISITHAEYNSPVADSVFGFPSAAATPLPDVAKLLLDVSRNQKTIEDLQKQYTWHVRTENQVDAKGQVKSVTVREYDVFPVGGEDLQHLIAKDGKPLAGDEKKKEDERFNKRFEELTRKEHEIDNDPKKKAQQEKQEAKDDAQISDFLRTERFTNPRRERFRGQDVIAFDFAANPAVKPKSMIENVVQKLAGVIWIDEQARDVVRVEAHFGDAVKIGGGLLASVEKGTNFVFEQTRVNDEVWLPSYDETHLSGRLLLFKGHVNEINRYSNYKKFHTDSKLVDAEN